MRCFKNVQFSIHKCNRVTDRGCENMDNQDDKPYLKISIQKDYTLF